MYLYCIVGSAFSVVWELVGEIYPNAKIRRELQDCTMTEARVHFYRRMNSYLHWDTKIHFHGE